MRGADAERRRMREQVGEARRLHHALRRAANHSSSISAAATAYSQAPTPRCGCGAVAAAGRARRRAERRLRGAADVRLLGVDEVGEDAHAGAVGGDAVLAGVLGVDARRACRPAGSTRGGADRRCGAGSAGRWSITSTSPVRTMRTASSAGREPVEQVEEDEQQVDVVGAEQVVGGEVEGERGAAVAVVLAGDGERDLAAVGARAEDRIGPRRHVEVLRRGERERQLRAQPGQHGVVRVPVEDGHRRERAVRGERAARRRRGRRRGSRRRAGTAARRGGR